MRHRLASRPLQPGVGFEAASARRRELELPPDSGALLAGLLECESLSSSLAELALPLLGELCFLYVPDQDGSARRFSARLPAILCPGKTGLFERRGEPAILNGEWIDEFAENPEEAASFRTLGLNSALWVPISAAGKVQGAILLAAGAGRIYRESDLPLASSLARQCAPALANARLYREAVAARDQAEKMNRAKDDFLAMLSHELRNSLMPVLGWARILKNRDGLARDPLLLEGAESLERNAENIARLAGDCLDLARILQGKFRIEAEPVDLNRVVASSMDAIREAAWEKNLALVAELSSGPLWISGDRTRMQQALVNILVNAVKYTPGGGRISIRSSIQEGTAQIGVSDTGIGMDAQDLNKIFEPFCQACAKPLSSGSGLGIGLAVSRQVVELHGGRLWAESGGHGLGSRFELRIPLIEPLIEPEPARTSTPVRAVRPLRPLRILLVEDSKDILTLMKIQLEALGHIVLVATDGAQGTERAVREAPDLIISDIKMPRTDGYSLIRTVRASPTAASIPAIALTGMGMRGDAERAKEAGFNTCLVKPVDTPDLVRWIEKLTAQV